MFEVFELDLLYYILYESRKWKYYAITILFRVCYCTIIANMIRDSFKW